MGDLVGSWDVVERAGAGLVEAGRVVEGSWGLWPGRSGSARVDGRWQEVADAVEGHLLAASGLLVGAGGAATAAARELRAADGAAAAGMRAL